MLSGNTRTHKFLDQFVSVTLAPTLMKSEIPVRAFEAPKRERARNFLKGMQEEP